MPESGSNREAHAAVTSANAHAAFASKSNQLRPARHPLSDSEQRLRDYARAASDWFWEMDENLRFTYFSERFEDVTGVSPQILLGLTREETGIPNIDEEAWRTHLDTLAAHRSFRDFEHPRTRPDGREVWLSINGIAVFDDNGVFKGYRGSGSDTTQRRLAEFALEEAVQKADSANHAKSEFLARMSHELRTPLNAILGFSQLLSGAEDPHIDPKHLRFVEQIQGAGGHLLTLIDEVLDLSRIENGDIELLHEIVDLGTLCQECCDLTRQAAEERGIRIDSRISAHDAPRLWADGTRLKEVILNFLSNAIKYNREGGRIDIACDTTPIRFGRFGRFSVTDTGEGLPADRLDELFEPFSRLGQNEFDIPGTGIGLAISRRLVELMGGRLGAHSTPGEGSTFWMEIPLAPHLGTQERVADPAPHCPVESPSGRVTVLYVEDEPANLLLVQHLLSRHPQYVLLDASDAESGLALARQQRPDVILMDIHLPGMSGFDALDTLKATPTTCAIPVIAVSADAMPADIDRGLNAGFVDYVTKPFAINELLATLAKAVEPG